MSAQKRNAPAATGAIHDLERATPERSESLSQSGSSGHVSRDSPSAVQTTCLEGIAPTSVHWLWEHWIAAGKLHLLAGAPGDGKTTIALHFAAVVSSGGFWPDGSRFNGGVGKNVLIWSGEDDVRDTIVPRLKAAGANLSNCHHVNGIDFGSGTQSFDPARHVPELAKKFEELGGVELLVLDPIVSAVRGDAHKNNEVRRGLQPLVDLAIAYRCALLGVTHLSKGTQGRTPLERVNGSIAFGALARIVLGTVKPSDPDVPGRFVRSKSNLGPDHEGFEYRLIQQEVSAGVKASMVAWGERLEGSAFDLINDVECAAQDSSSNARIREWLVKRLADGPVIRRTIKKETASLGFAWRTVQRARPESRIVAIRQGFGDASSTIWSLPTA